MDGYQENPHASISIRGRTDWYKPVSLQKSKVILVCAILLFCQNSMGQNYNLVPDIPPTGCQTQKLGSGGRPEYRTTCPFTTVATLKTLTDVKSQLSGKMSADIDAQSKLIQDALGEFEKKTKDMQNQIDKLQIRVKTLEKK